MDSLNTSYSLCSGIFKEGQALAANLNPVQKCIKNAPKSNITRNKIPKFSGQEQISIHPTFKNYLCLTINENGLNCLSHLHINRDVVLDHR